MNDDPWRSWRGEEAFRFSPEPPRRHGREVKTSIVDAAAQPGPFAGALAALVERPSDYGGVEAAAAAFCGRPLISQWYRLEHDCGLPRREGATERSYQARDDVKD